MQQTVVTLIHGLLIMESSGKLNLCFCSTTKNSPRIIFRNLRQLEGEPLLQLVPVFMGWRLWGGSILFLRLTRKQEKRGVKKYEIP